ncbi:MAG: CotH kinase family protein [bacterium]
MHIDLPAEEWERMRLEGRSFATIFQPGCLDQPFPDPFTWHSATVTIDGERFENVGVRKKGFLGSLSDTRPSIKVHFEKYGETARFRSLERMTFNNNRQDNSQMHQCLAYQVFAAAGVPAPRCSLARVWVNGVSLGVYTHVESMKKAFVRRYFEDTSGPLFEGQFSDFRAGWLGTFAQKINEDDRSRRPSKT